VVRTGGIYDRLDDVLGVSHPNVCVGLMGRGHGRLFPRLRPAIVPDGDGLRPNPSLVRLEAVVAGVGRVSTCRSDDEPPNSRPVIDSSFQATSHASR
jgi:hypothetical protein